MTIALLALVAGAAATAGGFADIREQAPELSAAVVAVALAGAMLVWMRLRGMALRPTLEMAAPAVAAGVLMIAGYRAGVVAQPDLIPGVCGVACLGMIGVMLVRFRVYSAHMDHHLTRSGRRAPLPRAAARFNRRFANPVMRLVAGWLPPFAIIRHHGRRTGRAYATPVLAFATPDGLVVGVLYGRGSDWVSNVRAAGSAEVKRRGAVRDYRQAGLITADDGFQMLPALVRRPFRVLGVRDFLQLSTTAPVRPPANG